MINKDLKEFLKYLKKENIIEEYEMLFDRLFDFTDLFKLNRKDISNIIVNKGLSAVRLYEIINKVSIDESLIEMYLNSCDSIKKYIIRVAISELDLELKKHIIKSFINGNNEDSIKYSYSLITKEKIRNDKYLRDYVSIVSMSKESIAYKMRELIENEKEESNNISIPFLDILSTVEDVGIADYLVHLYEIKKDSNDINEYMALSISSSRENAKNAFIVLTDEKFKDRDDKLYIALVIAASDTEYQSRNGLLEAYRNFDKDDLVERVAKAVTTKVESDKTSFLKEVLKDGEIDDILFSLSSIDSELEIDLNTKVKVKA